MIDEFSYRKLPPDSYEITQLHTVKVYILLLTIAKGLRKRERYMLFVFKCD